MANGARSELRVAKYWNGVATEGQKGVIAVKANGKIQECIWTHQESNEGPYSSEDSNQRDAKVSITEEDTLCKLEIKDTDHNDHDGLWDVLIIGKCNNDGRRRNKRQIQALSPSHHPAELPSQPIVHQARRSNVSRRRGSPSFKRRTQQHEVSYQRRTSGRQSRRDCDNEAELVDIELLVPEGGSRNRDISMIASEHTVHGADGEKVFLWGRTSKKPDK